MQDKRSPLTVGRIVHYSDRPVGGIYGVERFLAEVEALEKIEAERVAPAPKEPEQPAPAPAPEKATGQDGRARVGVLGALAIATAAALALCACTKDATGPTPVATPIVAATPTPDPKTDPTSCIETNATLQSTGDRIFFGVFEVFDLTVIPRNEADVPLTSGCRYAQTVGWNYAGPCLQGADRTSLTTRFYCIDVGVLDVVATHGPFKAIGRYFIQR